MRRKYEKRDISDLLRFILQVSCQKEILAIFGCVEITNSMF